MVHPLRWLALILGLWWGVAAAQMPVPSESDLAAMQARREALFDARGIDVARLSQDITAAVRDGEKLEGEGKYADALQRLKALESYMPLLELPSFDVHMLSGWLYEKLGNPDLAGQHRLRAAAMRKILWERIGTGASPADPLGATMVREVVEWAKTRLAQITDVKMQPDAGRELTVVTYQGPSTANAPRQLFALVDPRTRARERQAIDRYEPLPLAQLRPQDIAWIELARQKRERFLGDPGFPYLELAGEITRVTKEAAELDSVGKPQEALERLLQIERLRPIEEIPTPRLLSLYSYLTGKTGNSARQQNLRGLIFGVQQVMAQSGDGRSAATAIHVIFIEEEYDWLSVKKLTRVRQRLLDVGSEKFDVMTVRDAQGAERDVYFNITRMYGKYRL